MMGKLDDELVPVYNPVDKDLQWQFGGKPFTLKANDISPVPRRAVSVLVTQLGDLGVSEIPVKILKAESEKLIRAAERKFWDHQHEQNEKLVITFSEQNGRRMAAGLKPKEEPPQVKQAREWLDTNPEPLAIVDEPPAPVVPEEVAVKVVEEVKPPVPAVRSHHARPGKKEKS